MNQHEKQKRTNSINILHWQLFLIISMVASISLNRCLLAIFEIFLYVSRDYTRQQNELKTFDMSLDYDKLETRTAQPFPAMKIVSLRTYSSHYTNTATPFSSPVTTRIFSADTSKEDTKFSIVASTFSLASFL